jgi:rhodanese-related sulfurtransferase
MIRAIKTRFTILAALSQPTRAFLAVSSIPSQVSTLSFPVLHKPAGVCFLSMDTSSSNGGDSNREVSFRGINKDEMYEILQDYEERGREESNLVVIDVRRVDEIAASGKLSPSVHTLPIELFPRGILQMEPDDFEEAFGFPKPGLDETIVFTCAAGIRSNYACQYAAQAGYTQLVNYLGGAYDWFS